LATRFGAYGHFDAGTRTGGQPTMISFGREVLGVIDEMAALAVLA
jgi:hypothetical protein